MHIIQCKITDQLAGSSAQLQVTVVKLVSVTTNKIIHISR